MSGCGCGSSAPYSPNPGSGIDEQSNATGEASWTDSLTGDQPDTDISNRSPYGKPPVFGGISFCRKCFLTWAGIFVILALIFFRQSNK